MDRFVRVTVKLNKMNRLDETHTGVRGGEGI